MNVIKTDIEGVVIIEPRIFPDSRGYFFESYNKEVFDREVTPVDFVQDNESCSTRGVMRGLHFQCPPYAQAKLVRCVRGRVLDVAVDIRGRLHTDGMSPWNSARKTIVSSSFPAVLHTDSQCLAMWLCSSTNVITTMLRRPTEEFPYVTPPSASTGR